MAAVAGMATVTSVALAGAVEYRDTLDLAVAAPDDLQAQQRTDELVLYVGNALNYDNNIYRLPAEVTDLTTLPGIGPNPRRGDYFDTITAGLDSEWLTGARQTLDVNLRLDDNQYFNNRDLNNVSTSDRIAWSWGLGSALSGKAGADYSRQLGGYTNSQVYSRDIVSRGEYYASLRYQVGPRWGLFGGIMGSNFSVQSDAAAFNNSDTRTVDGGADFTTETMRWGFDYRYGDTRAPNAAILNGVAFDPDYREERARVLLRWALTEKTTFDGSAGYLKRDYPSTAIGSFSGEIWRASFNWQPTPKTQFLIGAWQKLDADLTAQTDYYVSKGQSITPQWTPSEKINFSLTLSHETQSYIGASPVGPIPVVLAESRHDVVTAETAGMVYTPIQAIQISVSAGHQLRNSNTPQFKYNDVQASVGVVYKFFRYGGAAL
jgi:hypothetical protein